MRFFYNGNEIACTESDHTAELRLDQKWEECDMATFIHLWRIRDTRTVNYLEELTSEYAKEIDLWRDYSSDRGED